MFLTALLLGLLTPLADPPDRIVLLGDSITKGVRAGVTAEQTFGALLQQDLRTAGLNVEVLNQGIGGERTDQALKRLPQDILPLRPAIVVVMYGTNDSYVDIGQSQTRISAQQFEDNLQAIIQSLRSQQIKVVLMTEPRWGKTANPNGAAEHPNVKLEQFLERTRSVARQQQLPLVDHFQHWTIAEQQGTDLGTWTTDQCHPNPAGHRELADQLTPVIQKLLQPR